MSTRATESDGAEASTERRVRLRARLAEYRTVAAVVLVVLLALGGWVSYGAYANPGEETIRDREPVWTATGGFSHGATVADPSPVHDAGTELENESLYYTAVTPTLDGEFVGGYEASAAENVRVRLRVDVVYRSVDPEDGTVYWSERERLAATTAENVAPSETVAAQFSLTVPDIESKIAEIERELEASPGETEIALEFEREIDGTIAGERRTAVDSYRVPIVAESGTYRLEDGNSYEETQTESEIETVPASAGPGRSVGGPLLAVVGLGGLAGLAAVSHRVPDPTAAEREWLAYRDDREQFGDAIATAPLPDEALEGPRADLESLSALAEFGIDVGAAIVFDPERELYVVREGGLVYVFEPPALPSGVDESDEQDSASETAESASETETGAVTIDDPAAESVSEAAAVAASEDDGEVEPEDTDAATTTADPDDGDESVEWPLS
ncbi:DUF5305 domain-containing protein [Natrinema versiforme]|uniref:DUF5305 domain-containing protein n=1 Tax=Natrinema versiforme JCM 10478 TaxID=1227496 RepID=L9Y3M8_9EURY|nr:DUF5305 domain-containing protein [Natrinema versiforme]ELY68312.1 hypothetical protein C489_07705 [Natrinema versiforme JCM 10478]